jgi:predicted ester cyclase
MIGRLGSEGTMSADENKALIRRFYEEVWDKGNSDFAYEVFADDYVRHDLRPTAALPGPAGQKKIADDFRAAFPDLRFTVDLILGDGDFVVGRWTASGTHLGSWAQSRRLVAMRLSLLPTSSASRTARSSRSGTIATTSASPSRSDRRSTPESAPTLDTPAAASLPRPPNS